MNKFKAAYLAIFVSIFLVVFKIMVGLSTNSISIISDAMHSGMDVVASTITLIAIYFAKKPADKCHNYGHGRYEDLAAVIQSFLIFLISITIISQAISRIVSQNLITETMPGIIVMLVSISLHSVTVFIMLKYAKKEQSVALRANALHLLADVITSVGVIIGLIVIHFTGLRIIDPIVAIVVAIIIIKTGFDIGKESIGQLLDSSLTTDEKNVIVAKIKLFSPPIIEFHHLRTRRVGLNRQIDFHLVFPDEYSLTEAHNISTKIEKEIQDNIPNFKTIIHLEPKSHNH